MAVPSTIDIDRGTHADVYTEQYVAIRCSVAVINPLSVSCINDETYVAICKRNTVIKQCYNIMRAVCK